MSERSATLNDENIQKKNVKIISDFSLFILSRTKLNETSRCAVKIPSMLSSSSSSSSAHVIWIWTFRFRRKTRKSLIDEHVSVWGYGIVLLFQAVQVFNSFDSFFFKLYIKEGAGGETFKREERRKRFSRSNSIGTCLACVWMNGDFRILFSMLNPYPIDDLLSSLKALLVENFHLNDAIRPED